MRQKRTSQPAISPLAQLALARYAHVLAHTEDLTPETQRNYLSDLRHFIAWCEAGWQDGQERSVPWTAQQVTAPTITAYRSSLQAVARLKASTINRSLVSIKRFFAWAHEQRIIGRDPAKPVKLLPQVTPPPRWLTDQEEHAFVAAVMEHGTPRDRALIITALHTGLRADELVHVKPTDVVLGKRSGHIKVWGKRSKYREVPLNSTARSELQDYLTHLTPDAPYLFASRKGEHVDPAAEGGLETAVVREAHAPRPRTPAPIRPRTLGHIVKKYAELARVEDVSPHDLRHRFGYELAKTVPLHRLAQIMGHDSLDTTMLYTRGTPQDLQQAVEHRAWT